MVHGSLGSGSGSGSGSLRLFSPGARMVLVLAWDEHRSSVGGRPHLVGVCVALCPYNAADGHEEAVRS